ncbi:MAG: hypothetical protein F4139_11660 [Gemmatimonadetes bacterium]|nr:hypothetical protein [Gemmatimonadota bacterium]
MCPVLPGAVGVMVLGAVFGFMDTGEPGLRAGGAEVAAAIDAAVVEKGAVGVIADPLFTDWVVAFELMGLLLLVAIVAAVVLAKPRERPEGK